MKANELMIGDWVNICGEPKQVKEIDVRRVGIVFSKLIHAIDETEVFPVLLTAEILEKNGFSCVVTKGEIAPSIGNFQLDNHWQGEDFSWHQIPMLYVHTLQHALRLCGIDKEIVL